MTTILPSAADTLPGLPSRISHAFLPWAMRSPDRPALVDNSGTWTYGQLGRVIAETRAWLVDRGVRPGDRVMVVNDNCRALVAVLLATADLDAWAVLVNARLSDREIDQIRDHCGARRVIYTVSVSPRAKAHAERHGAVVEEGTPVGPIGVGPLNETVIAEPVEADSAKQVAALVYTSGTTGNPKGVMLTHRNLLFVARSSGIVRSLGPDDRLCGVLPVSYIVSLASGVLSPLLHGATLYLYRRFDPAEVLAALEKDRLTVMMGVPAMFALLLEYAKHNGLQSVSLPALRIISVSGAPLDLAMKLATERLFGLPLHHGYGITECSPTISLTPIERRRVDCSVGRVLPGVEVRLVGTDGAPVTEGNVGELWVRGPNVMKGYYKAPEQTAAAINAEGWFKSRDLARFDDGNLFIIGRNDELIIRFGFNVYPAEIEAVLNTHPAVTQSAVIGRRVNDGNEEIVAFVQSEPGSPITIAELGDYLSQQLASYKQPSEIFLVSAMPASPTGKILKNKLASMVAEAHTR